MEDPWWNSGDRELGCCGRKEYIGIMEAGAVAAG
jgi:hypothetical protein